MCFQNFRGHDGKGFGNDVLKRDLRDVLVMNSEQAVIRA